MRGRTALVVGGGKVGLRKARGLVEAGARVTVVSVEFAEGFGELEGVELVRRTFEAGDVLGRELVFAATDVREVNREVAAAAGRAGVWVNVADAVGECDFVVPARVVRGDLQVAVSTGGRSPRLAVALRRRLEEVLGEVEG